MVKIVTRTWKKVFPWINQSKDPYYQIPKETSHHFLPLLANQGHLNSLISAITQSMFSIPGTIRGAGFLDDKTECLSSSNMQLVKGTGREPAQGYRGVGT